MRFALSRLFVGGEEELTTSESCLLKKSFILKFAIFIAGTIVERAEAIRLLREITSERAIIPNWVSLVNKKSGKYELHVDSKSIDSASLKAIVEKHNLEMEEADCLLVFYRKPRS